MCEAITLDIMPFYLVFLQSLPDTAILIYLGLVLVGVDLPSFKKVLLTALLTGLVSYFVRRLPLPPGVNILIQLPFLILFLVIICRLSIITSTITSFIGLIGLILAETILDSCISALTGISIQTALAHPLLRLLFPLPEYAIISGCIILMKHYHLVVFDLYAFMDSEKDTHL